MTMNLKSLLTTEKVVEAEYPGYDGLVFKIAFLSREEKLRIRKRCTTTKFDKATRQPVDSLDEDLFLKTFIPAVLRGWTGLKFKFLPELLLADVSQVPDLEAELEYNEENAIALMKNSAEVDSFVSEVTDNLSNFTKYSSSN